MRFIRELNTETKKLLERISWQSEFPQVRDRAKCILLSYQKLSINELMSIFGVSRKTRQLVNEMGRPTNKGIIQ